VDAYTPAVSAIKGVIGVMVVAVFSVHIQKGFFVHNGGYEYNLVLAVAALTLSLIGPGSLSIDAFLNYNHSGAVWGLASFLVGVVGGIVSLLGRKASPAVGTSTAK
jgi:putative oxidoreductase